MAELPDYYAVLEVPPTSSADDIKRAYKKSALKWHPDRVPSDSPERPKRTTMFQRINDAYYTLSDATRRKDYDEARRWQSTSDFEEEDADEEVPRAQAGGGSSWANMFGFGKSAESQPQADRTANNEPFQSVFEEMMEEGDLAEGQGEERRPSKRFWSIVGGVSGFAMGFIVGDFIGAFAGLVAGSKLGGVRDAKGKSVYHVFQELDQDKKARILTELATKLFNSALT